MGAIPQQAITGQLSQSVQRYQLAYIRPYHREIARRLVLGQKQSEIARDMEINIGRLSIICNSPAMVREVERLEAMRDSGVEDVTTQLRELAPTMIEACERIAIYGKDEKTRLAAAQDILDRVPDSSKVHKIDQHVTTETHEQRLARIMGMNAKDITPPPPVTNPKVIDVNAKVTEVDVADAHMLNTPQSEDAKEGMN